MVDKEVADRQRPLSVARDEFVENLIDIINNSGLPLVVVEYAVRDVYNEVCSIAAKQYKKDKEDYQKELSNL